MTISVDTAIILTYQYKYKIQHIYNYLYKKMKSTSHQVETPSRWFVHVKRELTLTTVEIEIKKKNYKRVKYLSVTMENRANQDN